MKLNPKHLDILYDAGVRFVLLYEGKSPKGGNTGIYERRPTTDQVVKHLSANNKHSIAFEPASLNLVGVDIDGNRTGERLPTNDQMESLKDSVLNLVGKPAAVLKSSSDSIRCHYFYRVSGKEKAPLGYLKNKTTRYQSSPKSYFSLEGPNSGTAFDIKWKKSYLRIAGRGYLRDLVSLVKSEDPNEYASFEALVNRGTEWKKFKSGVTIKITAKVIEEREALERERAKKYIEIAYADYKKNRHDVANTIGYKCGQNPKNERYLRAEFIRFLKNERDFDKIRDFNRGYEDGLSNPISDKEWEEKNKQPDDVFDTSLEGLEAALRYCGYELRFNIRANMIQLKTPEHDFENISDHDTESLSVSMPVKKVSRKSIVQYEFTNYPLFLRYLLTIALRNKVDPFGEYLKKNCSDWNPATDKPRLEYVFQKLLGAKNTALNRYASAHNFRAAVRMALRNNFRETSKMDDFVMLVGPGGIGKSTILELSLPKEFRMQFSEDGSISDTPKEFTEKTRDMIFLHYAEIEPHHFDDIKKFKRLTSKSVDGQSRLAYDRFISPYPRLVILSSSTNEQNCLPRNEAFGRRTVLVECTEQYKEPYKKIMKYMDKYRDKLWAEAVYWVTHNEDGSEITDPSEYNVPHMDYEMKKQNKQVQLSHVLEPSALEAFVGMDNFNGKTPLEIMKRINPYVKSGLFPMPNEYKLREALRYNKYKPHIYRYEDGKGITRERYYYKQDGYKLSLRDKDYIESEFELITGREESTQKLERNIEEKIQKKKLKQQNFSLSIN